MYKRQRRTNRGFLAVVTFFLLVAVVEGAVLFALWQRVEKLSSLTARTTPAQAPKQLKNSAQRVAFGGSTFDIFMLDLRSSEISLYFQDSDHHRIQNLDGLRHFLRLQGQELMFATNAGMFTPSGEPLGLYVEGGKQLYPLNLKAGNGNFFLKPNGVFAVTDHGAFVVESPKFPLLQRVTKVTYATQSGPLLVHGGQIHPMIQPTSTSKNIRSGVGIADGKVIFAISNEPVTFHAFALLFRDRLRCQDALYLDGAISRMYLPSLERDELGGNFGVMIAVTRPLN